MMVDLPTAETEHTNTSEQTTKDEFAPEKVSFGRRGVRRGQLNGDGDQAGKKTLVQNSNIHSSVIFAEHNDEGDTTTPNEDDMLFNEVDDLCPHDHEGGEIATEPNSTRSLNSSSNHSSQLKASFRSYASTLRQSTKKPTSSVTLPSSQIITDYLDFDEALENKRSSIVGGKQLSDMTFDEKREIFAPERSRDSLVIGNDQEPTKDTPTHSDLRQSHTSRTSVYAPTSTVGGETTSGGIVSSIDWSSLTKSCKRARETMRDAVSSHVVVKNMFLTHSTALTAVLTLYAKRYTEKRSTNSPVAMEDALTRTIETRRALRFAISCLAPSSKTADLHDESAKRMRQELQYAATEGKCLTNAAEDDGSDIKHQGLHLSLAELIISKPMSYEDMIDTPDGEKYSTMVSSLEKNQLSVRTLAARLLCNLVTDNPAAAGTVLLDIPFSPTEEELEKRMSDYVLESNDDNTVDDSAIYWSDLIQKVSQIGTTKHLTSAIGDSGDSSDREVLAAVVAALHNLLVSMEMRDSFNEIASEMKRIEELKHLRNKNKSKIAGGEYDKDCNMQKESENPIDALFEAASNSALINTLLRSTLPATTILKMLHPAPTSTKDSSRPKFVPPKQHNAHVAGDTSDSATEWISYVLERLVSRGLFLQVLHSAGGKGKATTPEQVVLVSCIRQAMDEYQLSLPQATDFSEFDMRRLSIAPKSTNEKTPHPLWGRGDGLRTAVPVLHSLANEIEKMRERALVLKSPHDGLPIEEYEGELGCTNFIIQDILSILAQCLGTKSSHLNDQCILTEARSVLGRETSLIPNCCEDLARIVDVSLATNSGKSARELQLSSLEQESAISSVRLIGNLVYQCRHNQDLLRSTLVLPIFNEKSDIDTSVMNRTGLHVLLSATSLGPACFTLREWCIVAIRNAVENNEANIEMVQRLEATQALGDTPELKKLGVKIDLDEKGNVFVKKRESNDDE